MKKLSPVLLLGGLMFLILSSNACKTPSQNIELTGSWKNDSAVINYREKTSFMHYEFTQVKLPIEFGIDDSGKAACRIGDIELNDLDVIVNNKNGILYTIPCRVVNSFSREDPLKERELELWITTESTQNQVKMELREMHFLDPYPMAEVVLVAD